MELSDILCSADIATGAIHELWLVPVGDVLSLPGPAYGTYRVLGQPDFAPGKSWTRIQFNLGEARYRDNASTGPHGTAYQHRIEGTVRHLRHDVEAERAKLQDGYYIVEFTDFVGNRRRLGTLTAPCRITSESTTQNSQGDPQQYNFLITAASRFPALYVVETPCNLYSSSSLSPTWNIAGDRALTSVSISISSAEISSIDAVAAAATLTTPTGTTYVLSWNGSAYVPGQNMWINEPGGYVLSIPSVEITLSAFATQCEKQIVFTLSNSTLGQPPTVSLEAQAPDGSTVNGTYNGSQGDSLTFNAIASDPDGQIVEYRWDLDGDGLADLVTTSANVSETFSASGTTVVNVTVVDNSGQTASATLTVDIAANQPPVASLVKITGIPNLSPGNNAEVAYNYTDAEGDVQNGTEIDLYRYDDAQATTGEQLIGSVVLGSGVFSSFFLLPALASSYYIRARVLPRNSISVGNEVFSPIELVAISSGIGAYSSAFSSAFDT